MAGPNDGWEVVTDPGELHAYAAANLPAAPTGRKGKPPPTGDMLEKDTNRDKARAAVDLIDRTQPQLDRTRALYDHTLKGSGPIQSLREYLPSQANAQFDASGAQLQALVRPATRTPGEGSMSDFGSRLATQMAPSRYSFDGRNEEALNGLDRFLKANRSAYAKRLGLPAAPPAARRPAPPREITLDRDGNIVR